MSIQKFSLRFKALVLGLSASGAALAQTPAPAPAAVPVAPSSEAAVPVAPTPPPAAAPADPAAGAVPPGYMLVPVPKDPAETRYNVQYPQARGALPPGMELPYEDGDPIPAGYRLRSQPRRGLVIAGSIVMGIPWVISVTAATGADFDNKSGFLLVPALGPWLALAAGAGKNRDCSNSDLNDFCNADRSALRSVLVLDGLVQTAGAAMLIAGIVFPRKRLVRDDVTIGLAPAQLGPSGYGLGVVGTF